MSHATLRFSSLLSSATLKNFISGVLCRIEDDLKNEDGLKNIDKLKNEDDLLNEDDLKN